ncbi:MAG: peptidoglycan-binding protein [Rhizobiaceae bacterium]|nr:peptidoglycan-binding protein [Rhizobiaceae bacterium]
MRLAVRPLAARPVTSGGMASFAVLVAFVAGNAFYAQPGRHPKPMMATRGNIAALDTAATGGAFAGAEENDDALMPVPLVLEVQTALTETGHYTASLDGRPGRATEAAIRAFQSDNALRVDGEPSPLLLSQIRQMMAEAPNPSARPNDAVRHASLDEGDNGAGAETISIATDGRTTAGIDDEADRDLVRRIQSGLAKADVAKLTADGILGEQTRAAIRTFEALQGLDVTGTPDARILSRLIEIGAVE